jgi:hypothetical protein
VTYSDKDLLLHRSRYKLRIIEVTEIGYESHNEIKTLLGGICWLLNFTAENDASARRLPGTPSICKSLSSLLI